MLPGSPSYPAKALVEQPVRAQTDATGMADDSTLYMLSSSPTKAAESDENNVEMLLVQGLEDDMKQGAVPRPMNLHDDTAATGRTDSMANVGQCPPTDRSMLPGRTAEIHTQGDTSDGLILLKRSAHCASRLSINTLSTSETTQLKRDIALWRIAKSSSPSVEPRAPQLSSPPFVLLPIYDPPTQISAVTSTISEDLDPARPPALTGEGCPDIAPQTDLRTTNSQILTDIETIVDAEEDVAVPIEPLLHPDESRPCQPLSASVAHSPVTTLRSEPPDEEQSAVTGTAVYSSLKTWDDPADVSEAWFLPALALTANVDAAGSLAVAPDSAVSAMPSDIPQEQPVLSISNDMKATSHPTPMDTVSIEELHRALVSLLPATPTLLPTDKPQAAQDALGTRSPLADEDALLTDDHPNEPFGADEPFYANAKDSTLLTPPSAFVSLLSPAVELAAVHNHIGGNEEHDNASADSPASSTPRSDLPDDAERKLNSTELVDDAEPTVADVPLSDVAPACASSASQDDLASPETVEVDKSNTTHALVPFPTPEATELYIDALSPILPVSLSSDSFPESTAPSEFETISTMMQSRGSSPALDTKMEAGTTDPVDSDGHATLLPHDLPEEVNMEVDAVEFDDLITAETITGAGDIPEYADAYLDLPPSSPHPSSSPPYIFSSSPSRECYGTPPSSSPPLPDQCYTDRPDQKSTDDIKSELLANPEPLKRSASPDTTEAALEERTAKRVKTESLWMPTDLPLPKRLTQASVAKQHKKLAAPFRSPVIKGPLVKGGLHAVYTTGRALMPPPLRKIPADDAVVISPHETVDVRPDPSSANKDRTANAAKQFKSPLVGSSAAVGPSASASGTPFSTAKATPTLQALQGKLQTLKQAIRIKNSGQVDEGDELERLVAKWTTAGREVAWAVWDYVKDLDPGADAAVGQSKGGWSADGGNFWGAKAGEKRGFEPGWGYDDEHTPKKARTDGCVEEAEEEEAEAPPAMQHTLGTMLRHMSIDPATLGWNEEEGDFVDA